MTPIHTITPSDSIDARYAQSEDREPSMQEKERVLHMLHEVVNGRMAMVTIVKRGSDAFIKGYKQAV